ncbi:MAG: hypothetical protein LBG10_09965 [Treponema sp.]|jgi:hypothetical protein|nr:hypothetical protein [Treponema sp.]
MENAMDTVENLRGELEACVAGINASGLAGLDPLNIEKLDTCAAAAGSLGMTTGKKLVENLSTVLKSFREGKSKEDSVQVRLTALDFYLQHIKSAGAEEEL